MTAAVPVPDLINCETGEINISHGLQVIGRLDKVISKKDFEDKETKERKPGGFEVQVTCVMGDNTRDGTYYIKVVHPEYYKPFIGQIIQFPVKQVAYQFGNKDAQVALSAYDDVHPVSFEHLIDLLYQAAEKRFAEHSVAPHG